MGRSVELARIIDGCKSGDAESFAQVIDMYAGRCYGYFYRLTGDRDLSDELLSELFIRLVEKIGSYKGGVFESWLFKIASNIFHDHLRGKQRRRKLIDAHRAQLEREPDLNESRFSDGSEEQLDKLQVHLNRLDADTRELILLRFYSQMSFKEIAAKRSEPLGTALSKLHRGLKKLRELMEG
ncbi:MAG TPA: RNA polymerase sigma factor [Sedimentisphaerales bacterium]|jgi:RNA polymerase sigma-70 factor (ECF subfamily)|nr:RNA polymerase sigma factor [Sedimentisphaerales bacterium]HNU29680.1 RNA polymerase sigma factor [Sedimentisphaerales bacterium]